MRVADVAFVHKNRLAYDFVGNLGLVRNKHQLLTLSAIFIFLTEAAYDGFEIRALGSSWPGLD